MDAGAGPLSAKLSAGFDREDFPSAQDVPSRNRLVTHGAARCDLPGLVLAFSGSYQEGDGIFNSSLGDVHLPGWTAYHTMLDAKAGLFRARAYWYGFQGTMIPELKLVHPSTGLDVGEVPPLPFTGDTLHAEGQLNWEAAWNLLIAGVDFCYVHMTGARVVARKVDELRLGVFLHDELRLGDRLLVTLGARLDLNSVTDTSVSPRVAVVFRPAGNHFLRLSAGTAFRKPIIFETGANFEVETPFPEIKTLFEDPDYGISNKNLKNEKLTALELGYRGSFLSRRLRLEADAYLGLNRDWIAFAADIRFKGFSQVDLENTRFGYDNSGQDNNIVGFHAGVIRPDGSNYGGSYLAPRIMLVARLRT